MENPENDPSALNPPAYEQARDEPNLQENAEGQTESSSIISSLGSLTIGAETALKEHQRDAFTEIVEFYKEGGREGYVLHPTGTGKTVLFVELSKELIESSKASDKPSRVIILVPKVDLVTQTVGSVDPETGKRRGFKGFAPEIDARDVHGHLSEKTRANNIYEGEVLVTTYDSFRGLVQKFIRHESKKGVNWEEEKNRYQTLIADAEVKLTNLVAVRKDLAESCFRKFEAQKAFRFIAGYEFEEDAIKPGWLTKKDVNRLTEITKLDIEDGERIKLLKRQFKKMVPKELWQINPYKKKSKSSRYVAEISKTGIDTKEDTILDTESVEANTDSNNKPSLGHESNKFSTFELFAINFISMNSRSIPIAKESIHGRPNVRHWENLSEDIKHYRVVKANSKGLIRAAENYQKIQEAISQFDLIICDEAHRSIGTMTWEAIRNYAKSKDIAILGLTATDEYFDRSLEDYYEKKIHEITLTEAIDLGINNPVAMFVHDTGLRFSGVELDSYGEYDQVSMREIRTHHGRNMIGVQYAKLLAEHGYGGIISTIPGDEGAHAKVISELLNSQTITDSHTASERQMVAAYVLGTMHPAQRDRIYRDFEKGKIDWIVYVDVLREGWDSDRAKALINMRPTRSPLLAKQRQGRIGRVSDEGRISIAIDLFDGYNSEFGNAEIPPVIGVDVFELNEAEQGHIIGNVDPETAPVIGVLKRFMNGPIKAHFSQYVENLESSYRLNSSGHPIEPSGRVGTQWLTIKSLQRLYKDYLTEDFVVAASQGEKPTVRTVYGRGGNNRLSLLFNVRDIDSLISKIPEINLTKLYVDENDEKWITPEGCTKLLSKVVPHVGTNEILDAIKEIEDTGYYKFTKNFGKIKLSFASDASLYGVTHLYRLSEIVEHLVPRLRHRSIS